jgi:uncharacterized protein YjbI with pentapeptide repeats
MSEIVQGAVIVEQTFYSQTFTQAMVDVVFENCIFRDTRWLNISLQHVSFSNCKFDNMFIEGINASSVTWEACHFRQLHWIKMRLEQSNFIKSVVVDWRVEGSSFKHVGLLNSKVENWQMLGAEMHHFNFIDCSIAHFSQVNCRSTDVSWMGVKASDGKIESCCFDRFIVVQSELQNMLIKICSGHQVRFMNCNVGDLVFSENRIEACSWSHSELNDGQFLNCDLHLLGFDRARLNRVLFDRVNMPQAMFDHASVTSSQFKKVQAPNASLRHAFLKQVIFSQVDFSELDARGCCVESLKIKEMNCRRANMIGQELNVWQEAQLQGARFDESKELNDELWFMENRPGHRMEWV